MAMKDLYRNRLLKRTSAESKFTDGATPQPTTIDGSGRPYNVERFGYNPDYQELKNNSQNSTTPNNSTKKTTSIDDWFGGIKNAGSKIINSISNALKNYSNTASAKDTANDMTWKDYADLISSKAANSKMELQTAMQRAQSASNDYLKALGLQGSGVGQSQLTDLASNYQNSLSNINATAQTNVDTQLDSDFKSMVNSGKYSPQQLQNYINQYGAQTGKTTEWESYAETMGATTENQFKNVIMDLDSMINSSDAYTDVNGRTLKLTDEQKKYAQMIQNELIEAKTNEEKQNVLDKYNDFLNNPMKYEEITNLREAMKKAILKKEWDSLSEDEKIKRRINALKRGDYDKSYMND